MRISRERTSRASGPAWSARLMAVLLGTAACGGGTSGVEAPVAGPAPRTYAADQLFTVEVWGAQAPDTVVRFRAADARTIVLRHGPPDNTVFAEVEIPAGALKPSADVDTVSLSIRPVPGVYGLTLESSAELANPIVLTFKYPVHFAAPSDSRTRYATDVLFEQALVVAFVEQDGARFQTLRSIRPASDNMQATLSTLGRYELVAPR